MLFKPTLTRNNLVVMVVWGAINSRVGEKKSCLKSHIGLIPESVRLHLFARFKSMLSWL